MDRDPISGEISYDEPNLTLESLMTDSLLPTRFMFRFAAPLLWTDAAWKADGIALGEQYRLPELGTLEGRSIVADVRAGWNNDAVYFWASVQGKKQPLWCRENRPEDSDGLQIWIDTRDTRNIHRASRFCHRFVFLPAGGGRQFELPVADQLLVDRARENANPVRPGKLQAAVQVKTGSYALSCRIPTDSLTGFNPVDHPRLGFTYWLVDRELGEQGFSLGNEFPFAADPSLWGTLELTKEKS